MNRFIIISLVSLFAVSCHKIDNTNTIAQNINEVTPDFENNVKSEYGPLFTASIPVRNPFETGLKIELAEDNTYLLVVDMKLIDGAYFASPFSKDDYIGRFRMNIKDENLIELAGKLTETPSTVEAKETYPLVNGNESINWVRDNTTYKQPFEVLTEDDFRIHGNIQFTLEPRNTTEFIPFSITSKNGKLEVMIDGC